MKRKILLMNATTNRKKNLILSSNSSLASSFSESNKSNHINELSSNKELMKKKSTNDKHKKKGRFTQQVIDVFNGKYKYYKGPVKNITNDKVTIISEETEQDFNLDNSKRSNSIQRNSFLKAKSRNNSYSVPDINININIHNLNNCSFKFKAINNVEKEYNDSESFFDKEVNKEILPGEVIKVNKEEDLLNRKIDCELISTKNSDIFNNSKDYRNSK
jgi:hypothetical protein